MLLISLFVLYPGCKWLSDLEWTDMDKPVVAVEDDARMHLCKERFIEARL